ncbi:MAG: hypothetical protein GXY49_08175 [Syntrophomonadaceae bacterium]|nr:hypothetical protein [Syntrophomonadaceae bacterium]
MDYDYIAAFIAKLSERFRIREITYDCYGAEKIRRDLEELGSEHGFVVFPFGRDPIVFCTYSGPHTGIDEAIPTCLYMGQFFDHMGFDVLDKWYILSEFTVMRGIL